VAGIRLTIVVALIGATGALGGALAPFRQANRTHTAAETHVRQASLAFSGATRTGAPEKPAAAEPKSQKQLNPQLLNLPANTWVRLRPARNPAGRSYSGVCHGAGMIYYFGGGHHSYPSNDVELYDVAANTWTQATEPENWREAGTWTHLTPQEKKTVTGIGGGWGVSVLSPKGRPLTQHTFQMHVWFPEERCFYNLLQAAGLWAFDPQTRQWSLVTKTTPRGSDIHSWNLAYDPELKTVFTIVTAGARGVHVFDRARKTFVRKYDVPVSGYHVYSTYDAARKVHVVRAARKWWTLDLATGTTKLISDLPGAGPSLSLEYDPESKMTLALIKGKGTELWAYDAGRDAWSAVAMAGERPRGTTDWDLLVYDPDHRCFLFVNVRGVQGAKTDGLFAFRYEPAGK